MQARSAGFLPPSRIVEIQPRPDSTRRRRRVDASMLRHVPLFIHRRETHDRDLRLIEDAHLTRL